MDMKAGVDLDTKQVYLEVPAGGLTTTATMTSVQARFLADQLNKSAKALDDHNEGKHGKEDHGT